MPFMFLDVTMSQCADRMPFQLSLSSSVCLHFSLQDKCHRDDLKRVRMHKTRTMGPCVAAFDNEAREAEYSGQGGEYLCWLVTLFLGVQERSERPELPNVPNILNNISNISEHVPGPRWVCSNQDG